MEFDFLLRPARNPGPGQLVGIFYLLVATAAWLCLPSLTRAAWSEAPESRDVRVPALAAQPSEDRIIVRLKPGKDLELLHRQLGARSRKLAGHGHNLNLELVDVPQGGREKMLAAYRASGLVEYAEPDYVMHAMVEPNDFRFWDHSTWHLQNTGIYGGTAGADIDAPNGWDIRTSAAGVVVAVVDTGIRYTHEDIRANMWKNPGETGLDANGRDKATNGIDDDGDGYVDDVYGINVLNHTGDPNDDFGHGTHVAGIIGATGNNGVGSVGVAWQVQLMACKFLDPQGNGTISGAIECLDYARTHGAKIVNASWGSYAFTSQALRDSIANLQSAGILFVAACGNSGADNDANPLFPASYDYDNIISVAATTRTDAKADFSNWGATTVDLAAPGSPVFSLWNGSDSDYRYNDGTSMAAPQVAGAAALVWAQNPTLTYQQVKAILLNNVDPIPSMAGKSVSGGRLNLAAALLATPSGPPPPPPVPPAAPTNLHSNSIATTSVTLAWADNSTDETGFSIERAPGTTSSFAVVGTVSANSTSYIDSGLASNTTYTYRVRAARSSDGIYSNYSNSYTVSSNAVPPPPPPAAPTSLQGNSITTTSVTLTWLDNSSDETGFSIERAPGATSSFAVVGTVGANTTSYVSSGLTANTSYTYRVRAVRSSDSTFSNYSNTYMVSTSATPPPTGDVVWFDDAIPAGAWTSTSGGDVWNWVTSAPAPQSGSKAHQSALVAGYHDHAFQQASDTMNVATGDSIFFYVYIEPTHVPREIMVSWNNGSWEHRAFWGENLIAYGNNNTGGRRNMGALPAAGQWVRLEVPASAVDLEGTSVSAMSFSLYDGQVTWDLVGRKTSGSPPPPPPPPAAPTNLVAGTVTSSSVTLNWTDNASNETGFSIERAPGTTTSFVAVGTVAANTTTYLDAGLTAGTTYTYRVRASGSAASSGYSNSVAATTSSAPPPPPPSGDVVWFDDAIPAGAWTSTSGGDAWNWVTSSPTPQSGSKAHQSALVAGVHDHTFQQASATMNVATGDKIFFYVYIEPTHVPREIMVSWNNGSWEHRAFWGENLIAYGNNNTGGRRNMGALPATGQWVRLEVPASAVDLEGTAVSAMSFTLYDGQATWDVTGRKPGP